MTVKALLYIFLLLGSSLAMASEEPHRQGFSVDQICDLAYPTPDQVPLSGDDKVALPVAREFELQAVGVLSPRPLPFLSPLAIVAYRLIRAPPILI